MRLAYLYQLAREVRRVPLSSQVNAQLLLTSRCARCSLPTRRYSTPTQPPKTDKANLTSMLQFISVKSVIATFLALGVGVAALKGWENERKKAAMANKQIQLGKASIGGDWVLIDHHGKQKSNKDFLGKWVIMYFGFSFCPDICPEQMDKLVEIVDRIDNDKSLPNCTPIFITLDPERDNPDALKKYCGEFSPKITGMTGTKEMVQAAAKTYRIYFSKGPTDEDNDYIVDHSIIMYLVNPDGEFQEYFGQNKTASEVYQGCKKHMKQWRTASSAASS